MDKLIFATKMVVIGSILVIGAGCNSASKKYDSTTGKKTESISQDDAVTANLADMMEQCRAEAAEDDKNEASMEKAVLITDCTALTSATAQTSCVNGKINQGNLVILGIALKAALDANASEPTCAQQVSKVAEAYFGKESAQANAWKAVGLAGLISLPIAAAAIAFTKTTRELGANQGDTITTGNITATKSDDPYAVGAEGTATAGDVNGSQVINIGSGNTATDRAMLNDQVDKAISVPLDGDSNFDEVAAEASGGIQIQDADGNGNEAGIF